MRYEREGLFYPGDHPGDGGASCTGPWASSCPAEVAVKVHSGEKGNQNFLRPEFWKPMVDAVHGTVVECNTAYGDAAGGVRDHTEAHRKLLAEHGWTKYFDVDLMDAEGPDVVWPIPGGKVLKENHLGRNIENYDSMLVLAHFKGHPMGGYGGALKQLAIGCASRAGKALIHSAGVTDDRYETWEQHAEQGGVPGGHGRRRHRAWRSISRAGSPIST